jgi:hypothetical protein
VFATPLLCVSVPLVFLQPHTRLALQCDGLDGVLIINDELEWSLSWFAVLFDFHQMFLKSNL